MAPGSEVSVFQDPGLVRRQVVDALYLVLSVQMTPPLGFGLHWGQRPGFLEFSDQPLKPSLSSPFVCLLLQLHLLPLRA